MAAVGLDCELGAFDWRCAAAETTAAAAAAAACTSYQVLFLIRHAPGNTLSVFHVSHVHTDN